MKKRYIRILSGLLFVALLASCKSAPEEAEPEETPVVEAPVEVVEEPVVVTPVEEPAPVVTFTEEEKNALIEKVAAARAAALEASADVLFADEFSAVDAACEAALTALEADGDGEAFTAAAKDAIRMYKALENAALADAEFNRIVELGFDADNPAVFDAACDKAMALREMAVAGAGSAELLTASQDLLDSYRSILDAAFKKRADSKRQEYLEVEKKARGIKAEVAMKDDFNKAHQLCVDADSAYACTSYEHALNSYTQATVAMTKVFSTVSDKRAAADRAIAEAKAKAEAAQQVALEADEIAPLPEDAEGFEEPETEEQTSSYELLGVQEDAE